MKRLFIFTLIIISFCAALMADAVNPDKEILRRSPIIDGKIINGEWDIFYEYAKDEETVTTYANWDFYNLYLGYSANNVEGMAICIDLNSDGWVIGDDNYLITSNENNEFDILKTVKNADNGITLISIKAPEDTKITAVKQTVNGKENMEISIPAGIFGKNYFDLGNLYFNFSLNINGEWNMFNPSDLKDNCLGTKLVNFKYFALNDLKLEFFLTRDKIVAGKTLDGKVKIKNQSGSPITIKDLVTAGEGLAEDMISSSKIKVGEIKKGKTFEREYHSKTDSEEKACVRVVGCEIYSADNVKIGGALRSFEIIENVRFFPFVPKPVAYTNDKIVRLGTTVYFYNESRLTSGYAEIILPEGWEVEGKNHNKFSDRGYNKPLDLVFRVTPKLGAEGHYAIPVVIHYDDGKEATVKCHFDIVKSK